MHPRSRRASAAGLAVAMLLAGGCSSDAAPSNSGSGTSDASTAATVVAGGTEASDGEAASADTTDTAGAPDTEPTAPAGLSADEATALLAGYEPTDQVAYSILAVERTDPAVLAAARQALEAGATGAERWAATYVWVNEGDDPQLLVPLVTADDAQVRAMAATGLIARGRIEGFAPLIALLTDETVGAGEPPAPLWQTATVALARFTAISELGPPLDANIAQRTAAAAAWTAWLEDSSATLTFDPEEVLWTAG